MKKPVISLIIEKRWHQIDKHGYTTKHDVQNNGGGQLLALAKHLLGGNVTLRSDHLMAEAVRLSKKTKEERLIIAATLIIAEIERRRENHDL